MHTALDTRPKKALFLTLALVLSVVYLVLITREFAANYFANRGDKAGLQMALRLHPGNADYHHGLGRYLYLVGGDLSSSVEEYQTALRLNPHDARYWFDLAVSYHVLGNAAGQLEAYERAIRADPTTPDVAWEAANLYLVHGETDQALREFRVALQNEPYLPPNAPQLCWRAMPDIDALLQQVIPARTEAYLAFLSFLMQRQDSAGTAKVWTALVQSHQPFEARYAFDYVKYLVRQNQVEQARMAWQQAAGPLGLSAYLPSADNLVVNGSFNLDVLNGGFDWNYEKQSSVALALDPTEHHAGHRSLLIAFDGPGVTDAGIYQFIPVQPNTSYEFTGYYKAGEIEGAGGPQFVLADPYSQKKYFASDDLKDAEFWKSATGSFTTEADTKLLVLRVDRVPAGRPIRGKLWIDDLQLTPSGPDRSPL
jgi:Tetratricopeptide repeat/Carbohydrate binding domain